MDFLRLLLLVVLVAGCSSIQWGKKERMAILDCHNEYRAQANACNMPPLTYSMRLEKLANEHMTKCLYTHQRREFGENLSKLRSKKPEAEIAVESCNMWHNEAKYYKDTQKSCGRACHYTQIVEHSTTEVGCALNNCSNIWLFACYYSPPGNFEGQRPFTRDCTEKCRKDQRYENGLCYDRDYAPIRRGEESAVSEDESINPSPTTPETTTTPPPPTTTTTATTTTTETTTTTTPTTTIETFTTLPKTDRSTKKIEAPCLNEARWCSPMYSSLCNIDIVKKKCRKTCGICND